MIGARTESRGNGGIRSWVLVLKRSSILITTIFVKANWDTADAAPTTQELEKTLDEQLAAWSQLKTKDVPQLNEELKKAGQPPIDLQKLAAAEAASPQTTTQDKDQDVE